MSKRKPKPVPTIDGRVVEDGSLDDCLDFVTRGLHAAERGSLTEFAEYLASRSPRRRPAKKGKRKP